MANSLIFSKSSCYLRSNHRDYHLVNWKTRSPGALCLGIVQEALCPHIQPTLILSIVRCAQNDSTAEPCMATTDPYERLSIVRCAQNDSTADHYERENHRPDNLTE